MLSLFRCRSWTVGLAEWPGSPCWRMRGNGQGGRPGWSLVVPVDVVGGGRGRGKTGAAWRHAHSQTPPEVARCRTCHRALAHWRGSAGGQGLRGAGVLEVNSDPCL